MTETPIDPTPTISAKPQGLIERVQAILFQPSKTWGVIAAEPTDVKSLYLGYVLPLAAIGPIASAIGSVVFGNSALGITIKATVGAAIVGAVFAYALSLVMIYVLALVVDALAPTFSGQKNFIQALKLVVYANTAGWVAAIVGIIPMLGILALAGGLYGLYLMFLGLPRLMKSPPEKSLVYMIVVAAIMIVMSMVIGFIGGLAVAATGFGNNLALQASKNEQVSGTINIPGVGSVDIGKAQQAAEQMAAQASAIEAGTATTAVVDANALMAVVPASYLGAARINDSTQSGGAAGIATASAETTYPVEGGTIRLTITDLGTLSGVGAMVAAVNVNSSRSDGSSYETVTTKDGRMVTESYDRDAQSGEYTVILNGRITVQADGSNVSIDALKNLVNGLDLAKLEALSKS